MPPSQIPSYRLHKATKQAVVVLHGRSHYLGIFGSPESRAKYDDLIARYLILGRDKNEPPQPVPPQTEPTHAAEILIKELVLRYWTFAKGYYVKNGKPTGELHPLKQALRMLRRNFGETLAADFGPMALKSLREAMTTHPITRKVKKPDPVTGEVRFEEKVIRIGLSRRTINKQVGRVKRIFGWAVAEELLPSSVHEALCRVIGLRKGRTAARELPRVALVPAVHVEGILESVSSTIRAMIQVQALTGCRPHEVVMMRGAELDVAGTVWEYRPTEYKSQHLHEEAGTERARVIFVGPQAQSILKPFLAVAKGGFLFRPVRKSGKETIKARSKGCPPSREHYTVMGYRQAIQRACRRAGVAVWSPQQLRHSAATRIRKDFGLESAQAVLGHQELGVTQVYAEVDLETARGVMAKIG